MRSMLADDPAAFTLLDHMRCSMFVAKERSPDIHVV